MIRLISTKLLCTLFATGCIFLFSLCSAHAAPAQNADAITLPANQEAARKMLEQIFEQHPDLILDVLRNHSEEILEIAQQGNMQRKRKAIVAQWTQDAQVPKNIKLADGFSKGPNNAPITIVAFSDFTCSFCRQAESTIIALLRSYPKDVRFVFKPLPKEDSELSIIAAQYVTAAFMQDNKKGWALYEAVFKETEKLERDGDNYLKAAAVKAGLDLQKLTADVNSKKVMDQIADVRTEADRLDIQGTPYFFVNDLVIRGSVPREIFEEAISTAMKLRK